MSTPWLLRRGMVTELSAAAMTHKHTEYLGELAPHPIALLEAVPHMLGLAFRDAAAKDAWLGCVAREVLLAESAGTLHDGDQVPDAVRACRPFTGVDASLAQLLGHPVAACVIPLDGSHAGSGPLMTQIWLVQGALSSSMPLPTALAAWSARHASGFGVFLVGEGTFTGPSFQLGATLAVHMLRVKAPAYRLKLAADWIISGAVAEDRSVEHVQLGNKMNLATRRDWLLPTACARDVPQGFVPFRGLQYVSSVDAALTRVTGEGVIDDRAHSGELRADELHSLVGGSLEPVLGLLLGLKPKTAWLWHSDKTLKQAEDIAWILGMFSKAIKPVLRPCPSASVRGAEQAFLAAIETTLRAGQEVYFNITSSNRLTGIAVLNLSRSYPNLRMLYRDVDAEPFDFTMLRFESYQPISSIVTLGKGKRDPAVNWDALFGKPDRPHPNREALLKRLRCTCDQDAHS